MKKLLTAALLPALLTAGSAWADVDLRGPEMGVGDAIVIENETVTEESTLNMSFQGQAMEGKMQTETRQVIMIEVLETDGEQVTHARQTVMEVDGVSRMTMMGQTQEQPQGEEMEGAVIDMRLTDDGWESEVQGGNLPPQAQDMMGGIGFTAPNAYYPVGPVAVGESWTVDGQDLSGMMGQAAAPGAEFEGESTFMLVEVRDIDGVSTAVITYEVDITIVINMDMQGMDMQINTRMVGEGLIHRSLESYLDNNEFEGDMTMEMKAMQNGQAMMTMEAEMPAISSVTQSLPETADAE